MLTNLDISAFLRTFRTVPTSQRVLLQLMLVLDDDEIAAEEIGELIKLDPGLATSVMRLSNSAFVGMQTPSESLEEAVGRLGSREIFKLVAVVALNSVMRGGLQVYRIDPDPLMRMAVGTAVFMDRFSERQALDPAHGYAIGLFHMLGIWLIDQCVSQYHPDAIDPPNCDYISLGHWERDLVGMDHGEVGARLMEQWGFPPSLYLPVQHQYAPFEAPEHIRPTALLRIAMTLGACLALPEQNRFETTDFPDKVLEVAHLEPTDLERVIPKVKRHMDHVNELLGA